MATLLTFDPGWGERHDEAGQVLLTGSAVPEPSRLLLTAFIQRVQEEQQVAAPTIEAYTLDLTMLARWASGQKKGLHDLGTDNLISHLDQRRMQGVRPATLARHLSSYRRFYSFLVDQGVIAVSPLARVEGMRVTRRAQQLLSDPTIALLMQSPAQDSDHAGADYRAQRDHAIVCMLFGTRLPVSAIRQLRWQQIDVQRRIVSVFLRNGSLGVFPLDGALLAALAALRSRIAVTGFARLDIPFCFPTAAGRPLTRQALGQLIQRWAHACGVQEPVSASAIRQAGLARQADRWSRRPVVRHKAAEQQHAGDQSA